MRDTVEDKALITPAVLLLCLAFALPVGKILALGFVAQDGSLTVEHFVRVPTDSYYLSVAWRTIKLSLIITGVCALAGFPLACIIARATPQQRLWLIILITLPLMTSVVIRTFGWMVLLGRGGLVAQSLYQFGLVGRNFSLMHTETAIILGMVQVLFPFMVLSALGVIMKIDPRLEEAARTMGATFFGSLRWVVLPLSLPGLVAGSLLVFTLSVSYFITPSLLGGARLPVLASSIYEAATKTLEWSFAAAQSVVLLVGVTILLIPYTQLSRGRHG